MRTIILFSIVLSFCAFSKAQDVTIDAFSASYSYESNMQYGKAIGEIQKVYNADSYSMNLRLGWLYYMNKDYIKSEAHYMRAIRLQPKSIEARLGLAYPIAVLEKWEQAVENYEEILNVCPYNSVANYRLSYIYYYHLKDNNKALKHIEKAVEVYPFDFNSNYLMALVHVKLGNLMEAKQAILKALQYDPTSVDAKTIYETVK